MAHRKLVEAKEFGETLEARMPRVQLASYRMQNALGLRTDVNPFTPSPLDQIGIALTTNDSSLSSDLIQLSPTSSNGNQTSDPIEGSGGSDQDADTDEESIKPLLRLLPPPEGVQDPVMEKENVNPTRQLLPSPEDIGIAVTSGGYSPTYLPSVSSSTSHIPITYGLYDRLSKSSKTGSASRNDLVSLSFHDLTPDEDTGLHRNELLLHVEAGKGRVLAVCKATISGGKWIYFIVEPEGEGWTVFGCPIETVEELGEKKETIVRNGVRQEHTRVELNMCCSGVPVFDGVNMTPSGPAPWLDIVKAMGRGNCRVRYLYQKQHVLPIR